MASAHGTSRARQTLKILQGRIASGEWPLNARIPTEKELVEELGVGRSTVREAIRTLANMGMLEPAPSRGTFVRSLTPVSEVLGDFMQGRSVQELIEVRVAIEAEAAGLAALRRSDADLEALEASHAADEAIVDGAEGGVVRGETPGRFHALILRASGNDLLAQMHAGVMAGLRQALARGEVRAGVDGDGRRADHRVQLDAIRAGDSVGAATIAREHALRDLVVSLDA